jgi:hypothetical protein
MMLTSADPGPDPDPDPCRFVSKVSPAEIMSRGEVASCPTSGSGPAPNYIPIARLARNSSHRMRFQNLAEARTDLSGQGDQLMICPSSPHGHDEMRGNGYDLPDQSRKITHSRLLVGRRVKKRRALVTKVARSAFVRAGIDGCEESYMTISHPA